ncbi:hypothetical protein HZC00_01705 [Candidatus Kaiserbacteria bacterium]|nr:hypothetical protein [Candidatus Kaiserbacteria bacterium]
MDQKVNFEAVMAERFAKLPLSVQNAITSTDVEKHLRDLAQHQQLHLDQWDLLENEVMLTLLGLAKTSELKQNIIKEVGVSDEVAAALANDIAQYIFQPIREELERQLDHPEAQAIETKNIDAIREQALTESTTSTPAPNTTETPTTAALAPAPTQEKAVRADVSTSYKSQVPSHERKTIEGDPYREQVS